MSTQIDSLSIKIESNAQNATAAIEQMVKALQQLKSAGALGNIEKNIQKIANAVDKGMNGAPQKFNKAAKAADSFSKSTENAAASTESFRTALAGATSNLMSFVGNAVGIYSVGQALASALTQAREWDGISARFAEGFGSQVNEAYAHVMKLQEALYINDQAFMQYSSNFATLARGFGVVESAIADMSIGLTELGYDIYAKNNDFYTFEEAMNAVRSAIVGEVEPIRRAGISIMESTLKETAAANGITTSVENMTEAQKAMLRYKAMVDQAYASSTVGTYIQELGTVEGSSRALAQQLKGLAQTVGSVLMPVIAAVMPYIQAFISLVTTAVRIIGSLFGISVKSPSWGGGMSTLADSADRATDSVDKATGALGGAAKAAKKLKDYTMGFDELNVIKPQDPNAGGGGGGGGIGGGSLGLDLESLWTDAMIESANMKAEQIVDNVIAFLQPLKQAILDIDFQPLVDSAKRLWEALKPFAATIGMGLYWFLVSVLVPLAGYTIENIIPAFLNTLASILEWLTPKLQQLGMWLAENKTQVATVAAYVAAFFGAFKLVSWVTTALPLVKTFFTSLTGGASVVTMIKGVFGKLLISVQALAISFSSGGGGLGGVLSVVKTLFSGLGSTVLGILKTVFSPFTLAVVAIASTAMVLAANWDKVVEVLKRFAEKLNLGEKFEAIKTALAPMMEKLSGLKDLFTVIGTIGTGVLAVAMGVVGGAFDAVLSMIAPLIDAIGGLIDILSGLGSFVVAVFTGDWQKAWESIKLIGDGIVSLFGGLWDAVVAGISGFVSGIINWFKSLWETLVGHSIVPDTINSIVEWFLSLPGKILSTIATFVSNVIDFFVSLWPHIKEAWSGITAWFGELFASAWALIQDVFSGTLIGEYFTNIWNTITGIFSAVKDILSGNFSDAWTSIQAVFTGWGEFFTGLWVAIKDVFAAVDTFFTQMFGDAWTSIKSVFSDGIIGEYFANIWNTVKIVFSVVKDVLSGNFSDAWTSIQAVLAGWGDFFTGVWDKVKSVFSTVDAFFTKTFGDAWTKIKSVFSTGLIGQYFANIWNTVKTVFSVVKDVLSGNFSDAWTAIKGVFAGWGVFFTNLWTAISTTFTNLGTKIGDAVGGAVKAGINSILTWVQNSVNSAIRLINGAIDLINKVPGVEVAHLREVSIPMLATGGFVGEGQMFIAREAGPELVGSMNGRTTVANNDQIVEGISQGVYSAVLAAMSQGNNNNTANVNVYLDGKQITAAVEKRQRERGATIMTGGVTFGY